MTIGKIKDILDAQIYTGEALTGHDVEAACGCDLMSDVLAFGKENMVLLTGLINLHSVRTADMLDCRCVVYVRGKAPTQEMIDMAVERDITLLATEYTLYTACGLLYCEGLSGDAKKEREP